MRKVVVNTTPLIALSDIGLLPLLHLLYGEIYIPLAVLNELQSEPARSLVSNAEWIHTVEIRSTDKQSMFRAKLHAGEVEAMILAEELHADLIIMDDNAAKKTAKFLGFQVAGTLGVLLKAKQRNHIDKVSPFLNQLVSDGLYIDEKTRTMVLQAAKEL